MTGRSESGSAPISGLRGVTLLIDLVLLLAALVLWQRSCSEGDDVWTLFLRSLAVVDVTVIALTKGMLWFEIPLLLLALALPSVARLERSGRRAP